MAKFDVVAWLKGVDKRQLFFVLLILALGFIIRGHLLKYELFFGFDPYYHARMASYVVATGAVPNPDPMAYYFIPNGVAGAKNTFLWFFSAAIYKIVTLGAAYDKTLWIQFVKVLPALYGALTAAALFFVGKEFYGKKAGYVMAFIGAVIPSFVYRTMAGTFEEDCLGFLWMIIGMIFLAMALKDPVFNRKGIVNAVVAGLFFGLMAITWQMFLLIPLVFGLYFVFALVFIYTKQGFRKMADFVKLFAIAFAVFAAIATWFYGFGWQDNALSYANQSVSKGAAALGLPASLAFPLVLACLGLVACLMIFLAYSNRAADKRESSNRLMNIIAIILLYCIAMSIFTVFLAVPELFKESGILGQTVGEENTGKQFFGNKYNALIVFPFLAILLIPIRLFREKKEHLSLIIFFWVLITLFMAWYKLKFTYTFGLPIAAAAGLVAAEMFYYLKGRAQLEQKAVALSLGFLLLTGIAAATIFVPDNVPNIEIEYPAWKTALKWMSDPKNTPAEAKMFNWWDEGHWISFIGERKVSSDNRNMSWESDRDFALFILTNSKDEALLIAKTYDFDYVILSSDMFYKLTSFGNYAYETMDTYGDPRIARFLVAPSLAMPCSKTDTGYACSSNNLGKEQMAGLPATWSTVSNQMYTTDSGYTAPLYIYRASDNSELYVANAAVNESMLAKLWFHNEELMNYFEETYSGFGMRIFRVKKEALP